MIIRNGTNPKIEDRKRRLGLSGDVYLVNGHLIESLESHKRLYPNSVATTIEDAERERETFLRLEEQERIIESQRRQAEEQEENLA